MAKKQIRITESDLHRMIRESVDNVLNDRAESEKARWENSYQEACDRLMELKNEVWAKNEDRNTPELQLAFDFMRLCSFARQFMNAQ